MTNFSKTVKASSEFRKSLLQIKKNETLWIFKKTVITRAFIPVYYNKEVNVAFNIYIEGKNIFYYDPNTYRITRYNDPLLQTIDFMGAPGDPRIENDVSNATLQSDGINVKYEYRYGLSIDTTLGGRIDIGYYGTNFILNGESPNIIDRN